MLGGQAADGKHRIERTMAENNETERFHCFEKHPYSEPKVDEANVKIYTFSDFHKLAQALTL